MTFRTQLIKMGACFDVLLISIDISKPNQVVRLECNKNDFFTSKWILNLQLHRRISFYSSLPAVVLLWEFYHQSLFVSRNLIQFFDVLSLNIFKDIVFWITTPFFLFTTLVEWHFVQNVSFYWLIMLSEPSNVGRIVSQIDLAFWILSQKWDFLLIRHKNEFLFRIQEFLNNEYWP